MDPTERHKTEAEKSKEKNEGTQADTRRYTK